MVLGQNDCLADSILVTLSTICPPIKNMTALAVIENLEFLQSQTLASVVQQELLRQMKAGELEMGAKLSEITFTKHLGVSRAAVREAFRALEEAGLVRLEKNRGVFVQEFNKVQAKELFELRAVYEEAAARRLAQQISEIQVTEFEKMNKHLEKLGPANKIDEYYPLNIDFHDKIVEAAGNTTMLRAYRRLTDQMHLLRRRGYDHGTGLTHSSHEHRAIIAALAKRDPDAAAKAAHDHVMAGMSRLLID